MVDLYMVDLCLIFMVNVYYDPPSKGIKKRTKSCQVCRCPFLGWCFCDLLTKLSDLQIGEDKRLFKGHGLNHLSHEKNSYYFPL